jgi:hypothetical protein
MRLVLNPRGRYRFEVAPIHVHGRHQLDVEAFLEESRKPPGHLVTNPELRTSGKPIPTGNT